MLNLFFLNYCNMPRMFLSVGEAVINDPGVSMDSSQFSSEVLVTQVYTHNSVLSFTPAPSFG